MDEILQEDEELKQIQLPFQLEKENTNKTIMHRKISLTSKLKERLKSTELKKNQTKQIKIQESNQILDKPTKNRLLQSIGLPPDFV